MQLMIALGLQLLLLSYFIRADDASIFIDGGPTFEVGDTVTIRCYYTGSEVAFNEPPHFIINGVLHRSDIVKSNLSEYEQEYTSGFEPIAANYTLTLPEVSAEYNGTSYQCVAINAFNQTDLYPSGTVTLIVTNSNSAGNTSTKIPDVPTTAAPPTTRDTRANDASIFIDGGPTFEVGDTVTIRCYFTGGDVAYRQPPHFIIDGVMYHSDIDTVIANLSEYQQKYRSNSAFGPDAEANYTLTLPEVSAEYNGTSYQCVAINVFNETDLYPSGTVTLIVTNSTGNGSNKTPDVPTTAPPPTTPGTVYEEFDQVELFIDGGPIFEVGSTAVIRCHYTGLIVVDNPDFIINDKFYDSARLEMELPRYNHQYTSAIEGVYLWANYTMTLPMVQASDDETTYQCILVPFDRKFRYHSNIVTLDVKDVGRTASSVEAWHVAVPIVIVIVIAGAFVAVCITIRASSSFGEKENGVTPHSEENKSEAENADNNDFKVVTTMECGEPEMKEEQDNRYVTV